MTAHSDIEQTPRKHQLTTITLSRYELQLVRMALECGQDMFKDMWFDQVAEDDLTQAAAVDRCMAYGNAMGRIQEHISKLD